MCGEGMDLVDETDKFVNGVWMELGWFQCDKCNTGVLGKRGDWEIKRVWKFGNTEEDDMQDPYSLLDKEEGGGVKE